MSEISNYEAQKKKLQGLCDEHNFTFRFFKDRYPITLVITPINDIATQMDMLGNVEETGYCSQDSSMCWYFENSELKTKVKGTFSIDKVLRTKIENMPATQREKPQEPPRSLRENSLPPSRSSCMSCAGTS